MILPDGPVALEDVLALMPTVRQSRLAGFDDCALSAWFDMRYANGWSTHPQAAGTIFHRAAAEMLRVMRVNGSKTMPPPQAVEILEDALRQREVPAEDLVRVPMRLIPGLRNAMWKFAKDNEFSVERIVGIEQRLTATLRYPRPAGGMVERVLTGQIDALLFEPPDGAIVLDWKSAWGMPSEARRPAEGQFDDEELKGLSYEGYFQQRFYGWLVMRTFRNVDRVTLREFYVRRTQVRRATLHRHQMQEVEDELAGLVELFDRAMMQGSPQRLLRGDESGVVNIEALGAWKPSPGKACGFCLRPTSCPIPEDVRVAAGGAASSADSAARWAARMQIAERIRKMAIEACKGWVETSGEPIPVKWSKGRRVLGWHRVRQGRRFELYVPDDSDRAPDDGDLREAMREATERAKAERGVRPRRRSRAAPKERA